MQFSMPKYEVKYHGRKKWEKISETKVLVELHEVYDPVTPVIKAMIDGQQIITARAAFRIREFEQIS